MPRLRPQCIAEGAVVRLIAEPPVAPKLQVLPFDSEEFSWQRFQRFCVELANALPEVKRADSYGQEGEKQDGIDIECELRNGRTRSIQCRKRKRFSKTNAEKLVKETKYKADEHEVWVTCKTGTEVSKFFNRRRKWTIRNAEKIPVDVRLLPVERARRIVEHGFGPQVRRAFLGPAGPIAFDSPAEYFKPLDGAGRRIRHDLPLVGRGPELDALCQAVDQPGVSLVELIGRGGIGKTRLLRALANRLTGHGQRVLFAVDGVPLDADAVDDLPLEELVIVVDDAHRAEVQLGPLVAAASRREQQVTVVLGIRPGGLGTVEDEIARSLEPQQIARVEIGSLAEDEVIELAAASLGANGESAERLADATSDTPLLTVLGGRLLRGTELEGGSSGGPQLRLLVLSRFKAEVVGQISDRVPQEKAQPLAQLVAALGPLSIDHERLLQLISEELDVAVSTAMRWLGELEMAGVVMARGRLRRVVPDVLADQFLYEACLDPSGRPLGRAEELWTRYGELAGKELLKNLAEVDWLTDNPEGDLLDRIWVSLTERFQAGDAWDREQLLELVGATAIHQPRRVLHLCRLAMADPSTPTVWKGFDVTIDDSNVREKLPGLLRYVGLHPEHTRETIELLWELGRDDGRETNPHPDHPVRALHDLAEYSRDPAGALRQDAVFDLVDEELDKPSVDECHWSPLRLLSPLLAREGTTTRSRGSSIQMGSYNVSAEATIEVRRRVRKLLVDQALDGAPRQRLIAAELLGDALDPPHGYFGQSVAPEIYDSWEQDQLEVMDAIEEVTQQSQEPEVRHQLEAGLMWHAEHSYWPEVRDRAVDLRARLGGSDEELVAAIVHPWDLLDLDAQRERTERVARGLIRQYPAGEKLAEALGELFQRLVDRGAAARAEPAQVLGAVARESEHHARALWSWIAKHPQHPLALHGAAVLDELRRAGIADSEILGRQALDTGEIAMRRVMSHYLSSGGWFQQPEGWEEDLLEEFVADSDPVVRRTTEITLLRLQEHQPQLTVRLALRRHGSIAPDAGAGPDGDADIVFGALDRIGVETLDQEHRVLLEEKLVAVPELGYFALAVLGNLIRRDPKAMVRVFAARLHREEQVGTYRAVPHHDQGPELMEKVATPSRRKAIRDLLETCRDIEVVAQYELARLVWMLTVPGLDDSAPEGEALAARRKQVTATLEALESGLAGDDALFDLACHAVRDMPWQILLDRWAWVSSMLEAADAASPERLKRLSSAFGAAAISGGYHRAVGHDSPRSVATRDGAEQILKKVSVASPAHGLYQGLKRSAEAEIEQERQSDDELDSGWA